MYHFKNPGIFFSRCLFTVSSSKDDYKKDFTKKTFVMTSMPEINFNNLNNTRLNFVFGIWKSFDVNMEDLIMEIRYNFSLTKSENFTSYDKYNNVRFKQK